ncbi:hypothetical protein ACKKBG_A25240 [Auxenochlorella protothecoides x Auxenochlorella symbiontica]
MVAGLDLALAIRPVQDQSRGNVLVQAKGIHFLTACDAVAEAGQVISSYLAQSPANDGSGNLPPHGAAGRLAVLGERYTVTYRLVHGVLLALVTLPSASAFLCLEALDAVHRVVAGLLRGSALTPAKVAVRFPEIYAALDDLLSLGLDRLPPGFRHAPLDDRVRLSMPVSTTDAKRQFRRLVKGARGGGASEAGSVAGDEAMHAAEEAAAAAAELNGRTSPLEGVSFAIPPDALPPPPLRALRRAPARAPVVVEQQQPVGAPPPAFEGAVPDAPPPAAEPEPAPAAAAEDEWAMFGAEDGSGRPVTGDLGTENEKKAEAAPVAPTASDEDVMESLQLVEVWRARAAGGAIVEAGVEGCVRRRLAPYGLDGTEFAVLGPRPGPLPTAVTAACLRAAGVHPVHTQTAGGGEGGGGAHPSWRAAFARTPVDCRYLRYRLPAVATPPPLEADLRLLPGAPGTALCVLRYVASPHLPPPGLLDLVADVALPRGARVARASRHVLVRPDAGEARLALPVLAPGEAGVLSLALELAPGSAEALAPPAASLTFTGPPGGTLSGTRLLVGLERTEERAGAPGKCLLFGKLEVRP